MKKDKSNQKNKNAKDSPKKGKKKESSSNWLFNQGYSFFDYVLMIAFVVLLGGMFYLKAAEEAFAKDTHKQEMNRLVREHLEISWNREMTITRFSELNQAAKLQKSERNTVSSPWLGNFPDIIILLKASR